jgi:membrane protease YdiL (CAAX protease family)
MKKLSVRNALWLSIGVIVLSWVFAFIVTIYFQDRLEDFITSSTYELVIFTFVYGAFSILAISFLLYLTQEKYQDIGFQKHGIFRQMSVGFAFRLLIFVFSTVLLNPIIHALLPKSVHQGIETTSLFTNMNYLPLWIFMGMFFGGFLEELARIFVLTRFERCFGRGGLIFALVMGSIVFGIQHLYQGFGSMISIGIVGFLYALVYLRKRLAFEPIIAHATFNTVGLIIGAIMYAGTG